MSPSRARDVQRDEGYRRCLSRRWKTTYLEPHRCLACPRFLCLLCFPRPLDYRPPAPALASRLLARVPIQSADVFSLLPAPLDWMSVIGMRMRRDLESPPCHARNRLAVSHFTSRTKRRWTQDLDGRAISPPPHARAGEYVCSSFQRRWGVTSVYVSIAYGGLGIRRRRWEVRRWNEVAGRLVHAGHAEL